MQKTTFNTLTNGSCVQYLCEYMNKLSDDNKLNNIEELEALVSSHPIYKSIEKTLDYTFQNKTLFVQALLHRSFAHEYPEFKVENYERLEFLGDAVLETIVTTILISEYPDLKEGDLSRFRSALVNEKSLAELSVFIGLPQLILMGRGEIKTEGMKRNSIQADVFESLLGAVYQESGFEESFRVYRNLRAQYKSVNKIDFINIEKLYIFDAKSRLQEKTMVLYQNLPEYRATQLEDQTFEVKLYINNEFKIKSKAVSKKQAERELAASALAEKLYVCRKGDPAC